MNLIFRLLRFKTLLRALRSPTRYRSFWIATGLAWLANRNRRRPPRRR